MNKKERDKTRNTLQILINKCEGIDFSVRYTSIEEIFTLYLDCALLSTDKLDKIRDIYWLYRDLKDFLKNRCTYL